MEIELTKDADRLICLVYKEYLNRRNSGMSKRQAKDFSDGTRHPESFKKDFNPDDLADALAELKRVGFVKLYFRNSFLLEDKGVLYMEQRFPQGLGQVLDWLERIKSAIPFM